MSDTPRTEKAREQYRVDVYEPNPTGFVVAEPVHASFARRLERENAELRKDKERLDWLIDNASISMLRKDEDGKEWWVELDYSEAREDIDKAMEESQ